MARELITIVDYGSGNLLSVKNALLKIGTRVRFASNLSELMAADKIVLPGVGAFPNAMRDLGIKGLIGGIKKKVDSGTPIMGICLGMQLLMDSSEEFGFSQGLGLVEGDVTKLVCSGSINEVHKVPNIGWRELEPFYADAKWADTILDGILPQSAVYFAHSYKVRPKNQNNIIAKINYGGVQIPAVINYQNVYGCQFHPEKSGEIGLDILENFCRL
jgi:glutamine amidotransferase